MPVTDGSDVRVVDNPAAGRYEAVIGDEVAGYAAYELRGPVIEFAHTLVEPAFEGMGVGGRLAAGALDDVRARGLVVIPRCPFIAGYIERHPAYRDLVASRSAG
jgi:predicted GNAT family acetyltransferase